MPLTNSSFSTCFAILSYSLTSLVAATFAPLKDLTKSLYCGISVISLSSEISNDFIKEAVVSLTLNS